MSRKLPEHILSANIGAAAAKDAATERKRLAAEKAKRMAMDNKPSPVKVAEICKAAEDARDIDLAAGILEDAERRWTKEELAEFWSYFQN